MGQDEGGAVESLRKILECMRECHTVLVQILAELKKEKP